MNQKMLDRAAREFLRANPMAVNLLRSLQGCVMDIDQIYIQFPATTTEVAINRLVSGLMEHDLILQEGESYMLTQTGIDYLEAA